MIIRTLSLVFSFLALPVISSHAAACDFGEIPCCPPSHPASCGGDMLKASVPTDAPAKFKEGVTGMPLPQYDAIWDMLHDFYGDNLPSPTYIAYTQGGISMFSAPDIVVLAIRDLADAEVRDQTIAHEASHLGTFKITGGQSGETPFRFLDEGFASIWQYQSNVEGFKQYTMGVAKDYLHQGKVSFDQVQDWDHYFGDSPDHFDYKAYNVGASFVFFLINRYGKVSWKQFLMSLGKTKDLGGAITAAFGLSKQEAENAWKAYIEASN